MIADNQIITHKIDRETSHFIENKLINSDVYLEKNDRKFQDDINEISSIMEKKAEEAKEKYLKRKLMRDTNSKVKNKNS